MALKAARERGAHLLHGQAMRRERIVAGTLTSRTEDTVEVRAGTTGSTGAVAAHEKGVG
jgi:hypothetical protein